MFQWRIYSRTVGADGKETVVDRSFSDPGEFENFATSRNVPSFWGLPGWFGLGFGPDRSPWDFFETLGLLGNATERARMGSGWKFETASLPEGVDLSKYRNAVELRKKTEDEKASRRKSLETALEELRGYEKTLSGDEALLKEIRADVKKVEKELAELK